MYIFFKLNSGDKIEALRSAFCIIIIKWKGNLKSTNKNPNQYQTYIFVKAVLL